jgi:hypothetical protein
MEEEDMETHDAGQHEDEPATPTTKLDGARSTDTDSDLEPDDEAAASARLGFATIIRDAQDAGLDFDSIRDQWNKAADRKRAVRADEDALQLELEKLRTKLTAQATQIDADKPERHGQRKAEREAALRTTQLANVEILGRFVLAFLLIAGTMLVVVIGMLDHKSPAEVAQFVAPIAALAGTAVG